MAKANSTEGMSKTEIVRQYLHSHPEALASQIVADLKAHDISLALARKTRYLEGLKPDRGGRTPAHVKSTTAPTAARREAGTKADPIRRVAEGMDKPVRPRDVVAALAKEGVTVSNTQVSQVLKGMGMRLRRRKAAGAGARASARPATVSQEISLAALLAAKKLPDQLGGVGAAKQAVDALAKLS